MPWNGTTCNDGRHHATRDECDVTDKAWEIMVPMIPKPGHTSWPRKMALQAVFHTIEDGLATKRGRPRRELTTRV